jgi:hypothetical protein
VVLEIAEGGGKALPTSEEVLVDAENLWTARRMPLFELALQTLAKVALHGGGADFLATSQAAAVDAVEMLLVDGLLVGFTGSLAWKNTGKTLTEVASAAAAVPFGNLQFQDAGALSPVLVADAAQMAAFISEKVGVAVRAGDRPRVAGRKSEHTLVHLNVGNLVVGQT